ncbi:hypothetical protein GCM10007415_28760 [Parapedobacter pyrenivorans]|uniref:Uncharacterized protein n=1 Tax=Parapedobacter pyrenivorans TaxID=1305674 RepID=A0A917HVH4_9SPHI|nr:hypothetical protein GCM10007415_28760 [Parapedobacter pyrenivorans]
MINDRKPKYFVSASRDHGYSSKNPDPEDDLREDPWHYIKNYMDEFESVLASETFADPLNGYWRHPTVDMIFGRATTIQGNFCSVLAINI